MKLFPLFLITVLSIGCLKASDRSKNTIILDDQAVRNLRIITVEADYTDFEETVFAIGSIVEIPANQAVLSTRVAGHIVELNAYEGDFVEKGQRIAVIESLLAGDPPPRVPLIAPISGIVVSSQIKLGQPADPADELMHISDRSKMWALAQIPEQEAARVRPGTRAYIRVPAIGETVIESSVLRIGMKADPYTNTVETLFEINNEDGRLRPGMRAEFSVILETHSNVLAVPREAIQGTPAQRIVFVKDFELPSAFVRSPVVLGRSNERYVEILEGLFPGDEVVTRGSYNLSFAGGSSISLKEALDAAHGHTHNEDGSEITSNESHTHNHHEHDEEEEHSHISKYVTYLAGYAIIVTILLLVMAQKNWNRKRADEQQKEAKPHA